MREEQGAVGPAEGSGSREVLLGDEEEEEDEDEDEESDETGVGGGRR